MHLAPYTQRSTTGVLVAAAPPSAIEVDMPTQHHRFLLVAVASTMTFVATPVVARVSAQTPRSQPAIERPAPPPPAKRPPISPSASALRFAVGGGVGIPAGDLGRSADGGLLLAVRAEGRLRQPNWRVRGDLSWDRFDGRGVVNAYSYTSLAANLVHHTGTSALYQFGGLGVYNAHTTFTDALDRSDTNLGMQIGIGIEMPATSSKWFAETGFASAFTSGRSSLWFPVRFGFWL